MSHNSNNNPLVSVGKLALGIANMAGGIGLWGLLITTHSKNHHAMHALAHLANHQLEHGGGQFSEGLKELGL